MVGLKDSSLPTPLLLSTTARALPKFLIRNSTLAPRNNHSLNIEAHSAKRMIEFSNGSYRFSPPLAQTQKTVESGPDQLIFASPSSARSTYHQSGSAKSTDAAQLFCEHSNRQCKRAEPENRPSLNCRRGKPQLSSSPSH